MAPRDYSTTNSTTNSGVPAIMGSLFTAEELSRLSELRENVHTHVEYLERVIDDRRMEFGRWLLEHGKITEGIPEA